MANVLQTMAVRLQKVRQPLTNKSKNEEFITKDLLGPYWFLDKPRDLTIPAYIDGEKTIINNDKLGKITKYQSCDTILQTKGTDNNETIN